MAVHECLVTNIHYFDKVVNVVTGQQVICVRVDPDPAWLQDLADEFVHVAASTQMLVIVRNVATAYVSDGDYSILTPTDEVDLVVGCHIHAHGHLLGCC